ncbi:hypothetical protein FSW04_01500 [Baekduia soli]|uniref:Calcineurin-like phosphoesterase domain-containing protein n=1 Tax=Baekduia soli TaxID=496014 RepID=A0A5B8U079_9ACTN|nr:hypothetical protein [Baekduia soli]QEC46383.1 hypothetical protein FSW04_01500 [Baekduia soli]
MLGLVLGLAIAAIIAELSHGQTPAPRPTGRQTASDTTIWAVGDAGPAGDDAIARLIARSGAGNVLFLGDVYHQGNQQAFARYARTYGRLAAITSATVGDQDVRDIADGYQAYWHIVLEGPPAPWYALSVGTWQVLSLDSEAAHTPGSSQLSWLSTQLARPGTCRLAFWHRPRFSADAQHGDQTDIAPIWNLLRSHAAIVVAAHARNMQRFKPIDGITEFISGAGGAPLTSSRPDARLAYADAHAYGALRLTLHDDSADYAFVATDGTTLDHGTIPCRP